MAPRLRLYVDRSITVDGVEWFWTDFAQGDVLLLTDADGRTHRFRLDLDHCRGYVQSRNGENLIEVEVNGWGDITLIDYRFLLEQTEFALVS